MIEKFLLKHLERFDISKDGSLYLRRFYLYPRSSRNEETTDEAVGKKRFSVKLHKICRSDEDRDLHTHPWWFISLIIKGGYMEETPYRTRVLSRGSIVFHRATDAHRLTVPEPTWTLVITGRRCRVWGFVTPEGEVPWREYLDSPDVG